MAKPTPPDSNKTWARAKDVLIVLVIPLLLWGIRQEIRMAKVESVVEDFAVLREDVHELEVSIASMSRPVHANTQGVQELHIRLEHITAMVKDIDKNLKELNP